MHSMFFIGVGGLCGTVVTSNLQVVRSLEEPNCPRQWSDIAGLCYERAPVHRRGQGQKVRLYASHSWAWWSSPRGEKLWRHLLMVARRSWRPQTV
eukprot:5647586-Amphidinium_carterae.2